MMKFSGIAIRVLAASAALLPMFAITANAAIVTNSSFESNVVADGNVVFSATGWTRFNTTGAAVVTFNPNNIWFSGTNGTGTAAGADGTNVLSTFSPNNGNFAGVHQTISGTQLTAGSTYTLTVALGDYVSETPTRWHLAISTSSMGLGTYLINHSPLNGNTLLTNDAFKDFSVQYTATGSEPQIGQDLKITIWGQNYGTGTHVAFDNVRLGGTYYWDTDSANAGFGNSAGTWGSSAFLSQLSAGSGATSTSAANAPDSVHFGTSAVGLGVNASTIGIAGGGVSANQITFGSAQSNPVTLSGGGGAITLAGPTPTLTVNNSTNTIDAILSGSAGMTKAGTGTLILSGANNYSGATTISAGTLLVNGTHTGGGQYTVASGATLGGSGTIGGNLDGSGTISPGMSPGAITIEGMFDMSGTYLWELGSLTDDATPGTPGTDWDLVNAGTADLNGLTLDLDFILAATGPDLGNSFWDSDHMWLIVEAMDPITGNFSAITYQGNPLAFAAGAFDTVVTGNQAFLQFTAVVVPEPSSLALWAGLFTVVVCSSRLARSKWRKRG